MNRVKLLIADSDVRFADAVSLYLKNYPELEVVGIEHNGHDALQRIKSTDPDAVLFDLVLPGLDGLSLLRCINEAKNPPATICCTRFYSDVAMEAARTYGASYLLFKPVELHALRSAILCSAEMQRNMNKNFLSYTINDGLDTQQSNLFIRNFIVALGVPSKLIGCSYLTEAVRLARQDSSLTRNLSKGLYLEIARTMNSTPTRIERCMRNAINAAYLNGNLRDRMTDCPSNKEFLHFVLSNLDT